MKKGYLTAGPVSQATISELLTHMGTMPAAGGHSMFLGQVRNDDIGAKRVKAIEYSAYEEMVKVEADKIIEEILSEFDDAVSVDIVHSTGIVRAGEISLLVIVSAGHRRQAIDACSKAVEMIKERLPVWKKEIYDDGSHEWRENNPV